MEKYKSFNNPALPEKMRLKNYAGAYLFGFNGQEKDDEVYSEGRVYTAEFWEYDAALARRWNIDPAFKLKPWMSSYHAFSNSPIWKVDLNGAFDTKYEDEDGNEIANTNDGIDRTVTVKNEQRPAFDASMQMASRNNWTNNPTFNTILSDRIDQQNFNSTATDRAKIATAATNDIGSTAYNYDVAKDNFGKNSWKCNKFVFDQIKEAGVPAPTTPGGWPLPAGEWADKNKFVKGWVILAPSFTPSAGDVAAEAHNYTGATGHTGIVAGFGQTISASDVDASVVRNDWGFRPDNKGVTVFRRYIGQ